MLTNEEFIEACKSVEDPELHIDIHTLGLIYEHKIEEEKVWVKMTFTTPFCPYGPQLVDELETALKEKGAAEVKVEITFDPPWEPTDELKEMLGMV